MINHIISHILPLQRDQIESTTAEFQAHVQTVSMKLNDINNTVSQPRPCLDRFSFVPASIALWNSLDDVIVSAETLPLFKYHLRTFLL